MFCSQALLLLPQREPVQLGGDAVSLEPFICFSVIALYWFFFFVNQHIRKMVRPRYATSWLDGTSIIVQQGPRWCLEVVTAIRTID